MVLPVTILIMASLICLLMGFYTSFMKQVDVHHTELQKQYEQEEILILRIKDNLSLHAGEVGEG